MMRRRDLILLLADGAAFLFGSAALAQEPGRLYRLGMLSDVPREDPSMEAAFDELRRSGFVEGQNLRVEGSFSIGDEETAEVAARLVAAGVDVIWTGATRGPAPPRKRPGPSRSSPWPTIWC